MGTKIPKRYSSHKCYLISTKLYDKYPGNGGALAPAFLGNLPIIKFDGTLNF